MANDHRRAHMRARRTGKAVFLWRERRKGWTATLPIYVLWCEECGAFTETHPAGYGRITCQKCKQGVRVMTWQRFRDKEFVPFLKLAPFFLALIVIISYLILHLRH